MYRCLKATSGYQPRLAAAMAQSTFSDQCSGPLELPASTKVTSKVSEVSIR